MIYNQDDSGYRMAADTENFNNVVVQTQKPEGNESEKYNVQFLPVRVNCGNIHTQPGKKRK